jgi:Cu(I)/Ag(I) efflux system membrane fusion protein
MSRRAYVLGICAAGALAAVVYVAFEAGVQRARHDAAPSAASSIVATASTADRVASSARQATPGDATTGRRVLYWHDPMVPGPKFDKPGKSPFMDMQLVPVYADDAPPADGVPIDPRVQQSLGIRTARAVTGSLSTAISVVGNVAYNERDIVVVQARSNGFVEKLFVRAALDPVRKGQRLAELYVPEWIAAQEEYLEAKRLRTDVDALALGGLADAAAQRMRLAGMTEELIREVDAKGAVQSRFTVTSPIDGVVGELSAREGMTIASGAPLFRLNGLATVWVNAEVPEAATAGLRPGMSVEARTPALAGVVFKGHVSAIVPEVNPATRTLKARVELANPGGRLVPGMFATVDLKTARRSDAVLVPSEAVIRTGTRAIVILAHAGGRFAPVEVKIGDESDGRTEIRDGVRAGDEVVVSGQFLIDSEANLKSALRRMDGAPETAGDAMKVAPAGEHDHAMHAQHSGGHDPTMHAPNPADHDPIHAAPTPGAHEHGAHNPAPAVR